MNQGADEFPIITISGSMRYYPEMLSVAAAKTAEGFIVLMPFSVQEEGSVTKEMLDRMHFAKIALSEKVVVVGSHIGTSTRNEIDYALEHSVKVEFLSAEGYRQYNGL